MTKTLLTSTILLLMLSVNQASAATPFFWDDFEREDLYESSIDWFFDETPEAELNIVDGSVLMKPLIDDFGDLAAVLNTKVSEFRLETTFRFEDAPSGINPFFFFDAWNSETTFNDWAGIAADGRMIPGTAVGGNPTWTQSRQLAGHRDVVSNDIHMVMDVTADEHTITAWLDGNERDDDFALTETRISEEVDQVILALNPHASLQESILIRHFAFLPLLDGDYNASQRLDAEDIDLMADQLRSPDPDRVGVFDLNRDGHTNHDDYFALIASHFNTWIGDSNLDGEFDSGDLTIVFQAGEYDDHVEANSTWATGDWNGDFEFNSADLVAAFQDGGYENGPRVAVAVPEPSSIATTLVCGLLSLGSIRARRD